MSIGGVFNIITNVGIQDKLILATDLLFARIKQIGDEKVALLQKKYPNKPICDLLAQDEDWQPTLTSIEKTHLLFINSSFKPFVSMAHEYSKTIPRGGSPALGATFNFSLPIVGEFINDAVVHVKLTGLSAISALDKVRYVEYPGHRLMKNVSFKVSNIELDSYTSDDYTANYQYKVTSDKTQGYLRNIGQEVPYKGYLTADPTTDEYREYRWFGNGPQTFKRSQPVLEMWIPILFWFKDIQCSLPNFILPLNQTNIEITFEEQQNLIAYANYGGGGAYSVPKVTECNLYIHHIFILPEVNRIFITRFGFQLIRVHRVQREILIENRKSILLNQLKWPIELMYIGFRPLVNSLNSQTWYKNTSITNVSVQEAVVVGNAVIAVGDAIYQQEQQVVQDVELRASDVVLFPSLPPEFYNNYLPFRYGHNYKTPDPGWLMMNFSIKPGEYQPSGHFNSSRARELYLSYTSAIDINTNDFIISQSNPVELLVLAECINFVLYKNNSMILRFST